RLEAALARGRQAERAIGRARTGLAQAEADARRARALTPAGVSLAELERSERLADSAWTDLATAELAEVVAAADLPALRAALAVRHGEGDATFAVLAPASGKVLKLVRESAGPIVAGAPLLEIGDPRDLEIVVDLLSGDAARTSVGAPASIEDWGGPPLPGRV